MSKAIINSMPDEILLEIFKNLRFTSIGTLAQVCRKWRLLALDEVLWRKMFLEHFETSVSLPINMPPGGAISWRMAFKKKYEEEDCITADEDTVFVQPNFTENKLRKRRGWLLE